MFKELESIRALCGIYRNELDHINHYRFMERLEIKYTPNVFLLGEKPHDETLSIIKSCDVLLLSSICEQMPNVILEALALGRPVIATKVGGIPDIKSVNLHLVDTLEEMRQVIDNGIEVTKEDKIMTEYSLDRVTEQYERLFLRLAGSKIKNKQVQYEDER